jgi:hypothetical protein
MSAEELVTGKPVIGQDVSILRQQTYFHSPEAQKLFKPNEGKSVIDAIDRRIALWKVCMRKCWTDGKT